MDEKIFSELDQKIGKLFSKKDHHVYNERLEESKIYRFASDGDLFLSISKVCVLVYGKPEFGTLSSQDMPRFHIDAPIVDGMFPLHLAALTSHALVVKFIRSYRANPDVQCCGDPDAPFYGLTPLEMALKIIRNLIPWTTEMSVHDLLSMFHGNDKVKSLMRNVRTLLNVTPRIRHVITQYSLQGKVVELAALLMVAYSYPIDFSTMYVPTADIPPELYFGGPMMLRLLVATRSASLIKEGLQLSATLNPEEYDNCRIKIKEMDSVRTLLESAERGDLNGFDVKQHLTVELGDGSSEGSQDASKVNTVAPQYLKKSLLYVEPSMFQTPGVFNSLMPRGYMHSLRNYDGLDIRNCNALAETIFRVLDGRKPEELNLEDTCRFQYNLKSCLEDKFKEAETLTELVLENQGPKQLAQQEKRSTFRLRLPRSFTTALQPGVSEAFKQLDVQKISSSVFSAIKKGKVKENKTMVLCRVHHKKQKQNRQETDICNAGEQVPDSSTKDGNGEKLMMFESSQEYQQKNFVAPANKEFVCINLCSDDDESSEGYDTLKNRFPAKDGRGRDGNEENLMMIESSHEDQLKNIAAIAYK